MVRVVTGFKGKGSLILLATRFFYNYLYLKKAWKYFIIIKNKII